MNENSSQKRNSVKKPAPKILVVDDQPINIKLLQRKLERQGFEVLTAYNGKECLSVVEKNRPDLILLDVMMPEMDGIETCIHLKSNPNTETIPVIFVTARTSKEGKLEGLNVGAVDYITKPIDLDETLARVNTQLRFQEMFRENLELQRRLGEARRTATLGAVTEGIAHNLNNLLGVVVGYLDLMKAGVENPETVRKSVRLMDNAVCRMVDIIRKLSRISSNEKVELAHYNLRELIEGALKRLHNDYHINAPIKVQSTVPKDFKINANLEIFENVLCAILLNALESYGEEHTGDCPVTLESNIISSDHRRMLQIKVLDEGSGIDPSIEDSIYEPFSTTKTSVGRGMGLTIARHALRNLGADIRLRNREEKGAVAEMIFYL